MVDLATLARLAAFANGPLGPRDPRVRYMLPVAVTVGDFHRNGLQFGLRPESRLDLARALPWLRGRRAVTLARKGWRPSLGAVLTRFARPLDAAQRFRLHTELLTWDDDWLYTEQGLLVADQVHATIVCQWRFVMPERPVCTEEALSVVGIEGVEAPPCQDDEVRAFLALESLKAEPLWAFRIANETARDRIAPRR